MFTVGSFSSLFQNIEERMRSHLTMMTSCNLKLTNVVLSIKNQNLEKQKHFIILRLLENLFDFNLFNLLMIRNVIFSISFLDIYTHIYMMFEYTPSIHLF